MRQRRFHPCMRAPFFAIKVLSIDSLEACLHALQMCIRDSAGTENPTGTLLKLFGGKSEELQRWADEIQSGIHRI